MAQFAIQERVKLICGAKALEKVKAVRAEYTERMSKPMFQPADLKLDVDTLLPKRQ
jgi:hypothetical protein